MILFGLYVSTTIRVSVALYLTHVLTFVLLALIILISFCVLLSVNILQLFPFL